MTAQNSIKRHIRITSEAEFGKQMKNIIALFAQKETEETWEDFSTAFKSISSWIKEDRVTEYESFGTYIKELKLAINRSLSSQRTRLSSVASAMLKDMAECMTIKYRKLNDLFSPTIIEQFGRTNKTHTKCILEDYKAVIKASKLPNLIPTYCDILTNRIKHKNNANLRVSIGDCLVSLLQANSAANITKYITTIEKTIQTAALDSNANVRAIVRSLYHAYSEKLPIAQFEKKLTPQQLKYLRQSPSPSPSSSNSSNKATSGTSHTANTTNTNKFAASASSIRASTNTSSSISGSTTTIKKAKVATTSVNTTNTNTTRTNTTSSNKKTEFAAASISTITSNTINSSTKVKVAETAATTSASGAHTSRANTSKNTKVAAVATSTSSIDTINSSKKAKFVAAVTSTTPMNTTIAAAAAAVASTISTNTTAMSTNTTNTTSSNFATNRKDLWKNKTSTVSKLAQNKRVQVRGLMMSKKPIAGLSKNTKTVPKKSLLVKGKKRSSSVAFGNEENIDGDKRLRQGVGGRR